MRWKLALLLSFGLLLVVAVGCGGGEEVTPTPETVVGSVPAATVGETETEEETDTGGDETTDGGGEGDAAAGKEVFASAGCASCHTLADAGSTGTVGPNLDETMPDAELVTERVTNGAGAMPAFEGQLTEQQIADVSAYVSSVAGA